MFSHSGQTATVLGSVLKSSREISFKKIRSVSQYKIYSSFVKFGIKNLENLPFIEESET